MLYSFYPGVFMKQWFLSIMIAFAASVCATEATNVGSIAGKVVLESGKGYFLLSDGTFWKVYPFVKRWRTLFEWIKGTELAIPDNYEGLPADWTLSAEVEAYPKYGNLSIDEANASNEDDLKKCTHLLFNRGTGQILFAILLHPADFMIQIFNDGVSEGASNGYSKGYSSGYSAGYNVGYSTGYSDSHVNSH